VCVICPAKALSAVAERTQGAFAERAASAKIWPKNRSLRTLGEKIVLSADLQRRAVRRY
jgi:hypothetical protein